MTNITDAQANPTPTSQPAGNQTRRWSVLLVDDEPDILTSVQLVLERSKKGVKVLTASSGAEGLDILGKAHVDLVISDFKMPGMDGIEFLAKVRALRPEIPRIMFTAYADAELAKRALTEAFVRDFLSKTLGSTELVAKVEALLGEPGAADANQGPGHAEPLDSAATEAS